WPKVHRGRTKISIPYRFTSSGIPVPTLFRTKYHNRRIISIAPVPKEAFATHPGKHSPTHTARRLQVTYGKLYVNSAPIRFKCILHRQLPSEAMIKRINWVGRKNIFGWRWALDIVVEIPPMKADSALPRP